MTVIGLRTVDYTSKKTNQPVSGMELYYTYDRNGVIGKCCDKAWISKNTLLEMGGEIPSVGDEIDFVYNRYGSVVGWKLFNK